MPSVGHVIVGLAVARLHAGPAPLRPAPAAALVALAMAPDVDFLARGLVAAGSPWLHRGALHSLPVCLLAAAAVALAWPRDPPGGRRRLFLAGALAAASHPLLDAVTWGGAGVMFLWPIDQARYLAPLHLLSAAPMGLGLLSPHGLSLLRLEALVFSPLLAYALWPRRRDPHRLSPGRPALRVEDRG